MKDNQSVLKFREKGFVNTPREKIESTRYPEEKAEYVENIWFIFDTLEAKHTSDLLKGHFPEYEGRKLKESGLELEGRDLESLNH